MLICKYIYTYVNQASAFFLSVAVLKYIDDQTHTTIDFH